MSRFKLKTYTVGFIVPFFDESDPSHLDVLSSNISDKYCDWFDTLSVNLYIKTMPDQNKIILFDLVVRVDTLNVSKDKLELDWKHMQDGIKSDMDEFLKSRKLIYKLLE